MGEKMNDNEIIKALECFKSEDCLGEQCPYFEMSGLCGKPMCSDVYDFIYRQKTEIERLQSDNVKLHTIIPKMLVEAKSEAYREFAERFNDLLKEYAPYDTFHIYEIKDRIDIVEDELTESNE